MDGHSRRGQIQRYALWGDRVVQLSRGLFQDTLPHFDQPCLVVFEDVDPQSSLETCIRYLWPLLGDGRSFFTHEAPHLEMVSLFFNERWWREHLDCNPPGLIGAGTG